MVERSPAQQLVQLKVVERDGQQTLRIETLKSHKEEFLKIGQTISFKKKTDVDFTSGKIIGITDSAITLEVKQQGNVTTDYADLAGIRIPRGASRKVLGVSLVALGLVTLIDGINQTQGSDPTGIASGGKTIEKVIAVPMMVAGIALFVVPKSIKFQAPLGRADSSAHTAEGSQEMKSETTPQVGYRKFKVGLGAGLVGPYEGFALYVEPMYRITDDVAIGIKYEATDGKASTNSIALGFQYYFGKEKFRPFIGGGIGSFSSGGTGFFPRAGFDFSDFNFTFDYNLLPNKSVPVYDASGAYSYTSVKKYAYFAIKVGYSIGGGRRKK